MERPYVNFGAYIKSIRETTSLTQKQTSEAIGLSSKQAYNLIENGFTLLQPRYQKKFCKLFNIPESELLLRWARQVYLRDCLMSRKTKIKP